MSKGLSLLISEALQVKKNLFELPPLLNVSLTPTPSLLLRVMTFGSRKSQTFYGNRVAEAFYKYAKDWPYQALGKQRLKDHQKAYIYERLVRWHADELMLKAASFSGFTNSEGLQKFLSGTAKRYRDRFKEESLNIANRKGIIGARDDQQEYIDDNTSRLVSEGDIANDKFLASKAVLKGGSIFALPSVNDQLEYQYSEIISVCEALESFAIEQGKVFVMLTMTAPSEYHPSPSLGNSTWNRKPVKAAHEQIKSNWDKFRKKLSKQNFKFTLDTNEKYTNIFGIRVVEPHKDGTPHWHAMFFLDPKYVGAFEEIARSIWSWSERACYLTVQNHSDSQLASATSYITKYLTKSFGINFDSTNESENTNEKILKWRKALKLRAYNRIGFNGKIAQYRAARKLPNIRYELDDDIANFLKDYTPEKHGDNLLEVMSVGLLRTIQAAQDSVKFEGRAFENGKWVPTSEKCSDGPYERFFRNNSEFKLEKLETSIGVRTIVRDERVTLLVSHISKIIDAPLV